MLHHQLPVLKQLIRKYKAATQAHTLTHDSDTLIHAQSRGLLHTQAMWQNVSRSHEHRQH